MGDPSLAELFAEASTQGSPNKASKRVISAGSAITSATRLLTGPQTDHPGVKRRWRNVFGGHDGSLLYLACTDWRVIARHLVMRGIGVSRLAG